MLKHGPGMAGIATAAGQLRQHPLDRNDQTMMLVSRQRPGIFMDWGPKRAYPLDRLSKVLKSSICMREKLSVDKGSVQTQDCFTFEMP